MEFINKNYKCIGCKPEEVFINEQCELCKEGTFKLNINDKICTECMIKCLICKDTKTCDKCVDGYNYNTTKKICEESKCDPTCKTCKLP